MSRWMKGILGAAGRARCRACGAHVGLHPSAWGIGAAAAIIGPILGVHLRDRGPFMVMELLGWTSMSLGATARTFLSVATLVITVVSVCIPLFLLQVNFVPLVKK